MSRKTLQQYLELISNSGIDNLYISDSDIDLTEVSQEKKLLLQQRCAQYKDCKKCELHKQRMNFVYGEGNPSAKMMLIGEGPGSDENKQGRPFVGKAGQLLTRMLLAINLQREEVYITNVVKCQPPGNRNPMPEEVSSCLPYLKEQIDIIAPKMIVLLGKVAAGSLFETKEPMSTLRQKTFRYEGIETYITYHPAALIYNESLKKDSWEDLKKIRAIYDLK
ncbi:MAG: uracil-DNA glycosylase [Candidatus Cloacimonetes bacterium]|nr:uracil-DNA glycosylase [Candidatus Cloacimonadota bacterium]